MDTRVPDGSVGPVMQRITSKLVWGTPIVFFAIADYKFPTVAQILAPSHPAKALLLRLKCDSLEGEKYWIPSSAIHAVTNLWQYRKHGGEKLVHRTSRCAFHGRPE